MVSCLVLGMFACVSILGAGAAKLTYDATQTSPECRYCWSGETEAVKSASLSECNELDLMLFKPSENFTAGLGPAPEKVVPSPQT